VRRRATGRVPVITARVVHDLCMKKMQTTESCSELQEEYEV
jgi:hypothetical protein